MLKEFYYLSVVNNFQWDCFSPFRKIISSSENILMQFRRIRIDLTNHIQSPLFERILDSNRLKWECKSSFSSHIHLTYLTFSCMCMCIFEKSKPIVTCSQNLMCGGLSTEMTIYWTIK